MDDIELTLLLKYPLISKRLKENVVIYTGLIYVNDEDYQIYIREASESDFQIKLPDNLKYLHDELDVLFTKLTTKNVVTALDTICSLVTAKSPSTKLVNHSDIFSHVLHEYSDFTKFYLNLKSNCLSYDLTKIYISMLDEQNREHNLEISVSFDDKDLFSITSYDLPQEIETFKKSSSLKDVYDQFLRAIDTFQPFFSIMDEFDRSCWILDPEQPTRSCNYRRIWISDNCSIIVTLDPYNVVKIPDVKFLGPERLVEGYRTTLNGNIEKWDWTHGVFLELLKLLGLECFPQKPETVRNEPDLLFENGDCCICFSLRLNDTLPDVICKNKFCEKCYHAECLYEWLMSVNARRFFSEVVGLCPNCEKNITCPIPKQ